MAKFGNTHFCAERLTQAREWMSLTKRSLAILADVSAQSISNYESDQSKPTDAVVDALAEVLRVRREFLLTSAPIDRPETVFWRAMASDTVQSQKRTTALLGWSIEALDVLQDFVEIPSLALPALNLPSWNRLSYEDIEQVAEDVRGHFGLGKRPIADLSLAIENVGIPIFTFDVENPKQAGFMHRSVRLQRPVIGINMYHQSWSRQRFSLAHELGHAVLHSTVPPVTLRTSADNAELERQAHRFAGAFLFPRDAFTNQAHNFSLEEFATLKRSWGIGVLAQIVRARDLRLISEQHQKHLFMTAARRGYRKPRGEPWDDLPLERPRICRRAVEAVKEAGPDLVAELLHDLMPPLSALEEAFDCQIRELDPQPAENVVQLRPRRV